MRERGPQPAIGRVENRQLDAIAFHRDIKDVAKIRDGEELARLLELLALGTGWIVQLPLGMDELVGKTFDIWVSAKLSGPHFHPGTEGPNYIWIDRIVLVEPEE